MSTAPQFSTGDQDAQDVMRRMGDKQIHRPPVVDINSNPVGIVSPSDLALRQPGHIDQTVPCDPGAFCHAGRRRPRARKAVPSKAR